MDTCFCIMSLATGMHFGFFSRSEGDKIVEKSDKLFQKFYAWFLKVLYFVLIML